MLSIKKQILIVIGVFIVLLSLGVLVVTQNMTLKSQQTEVVKKQEQHWFILHRKSQKEDLYFGIPGDANKSKLVKTFTVKTGIPGERPTPLPKLMGREYWLLVEKHPEVDNPETAPYFMTLDVPAPSDPPYVMTSGLRYTVSSRTCPLRYTIPPSTAIASFASPMILFIYNLSSSVGE